MNSNLHCISFSFWCSTQTKGLAHTDGQSISKSERQDHERG